MVRAEGWPGSSIQIDDRDGSVGPNHDVVWTEASVYESGGFQRQRCLQPFICDQGEVDGVPLLAESRHHLAHRAARHALHYDEREAPL